MPLWLQCLLAFAVLFQPLKSIAVALGPRVLPVGRKAIGRATSFIGPLWARILAGFLAGVLVTLLCVGAVGVLGGIKWPSIPWPIPNILVEHGPRRVLIVRETADATPQLNGELVLLRKDPIAAYLTSKGHTLDILDLDAKDKDGNPSVAVTEFKTNYANLKPPALLVISKDKRVVHAEALPVGVKASAILDTIKAKE